MNDKKPLVSSEDYGKDEDTADTLIKKHEVIEKDIIGMVFICIRMYVHNYIAMYIRSYIG